MTPTKEVKLEDFGLLKQGLKRKIKNVKGDKTRLIKLLDKRGTLYAIEDLKYIIKTIYSDPIVIDQSLSKYYSKKNNKKFKTLMDLIEISEKDNLNEKLYSEIKELHQVSSLVSLEKDNFDKKIMEIALKYSITFSAVEVIFNEIENKWFEQIK